MPTNLTKQQQEYFDVISNQFPKDKIIKPTPAQRLEFFHMLKVSELEMSDKILEIGCGSGRLTIPFLGLGYNVHAVDISEASLRSLTDSYNKIKSDKKGKLTTSTSIPVKGKYDVIIGSDILHHIDIKDYLPKFYSLLNNNGYILFSEPNSWHFPWYLHILLTTKWEIEKRIISCNITNLTDVLKLSGFKNISIYGHGLIPTPLLNNFPRFANFNAFLLGNLPFLKLFAFRLIIVAKK